MARNPQYRTYPRTGSAVDAPPVEIKTPGTKIYCWRFKTPWGWCGGDKSDHWTTNKSAVLAMFAWCVYPCELLEDVVR